MSSLIPPSTVVANLNASFCETIVDEWARAGVVRAFGSPGSRSTPLLLALENHPQITVTMFIDERAASFAALGFSRASQTPAVLICTSGTAGAHFYGAIIEADLSCIPLLVCTADRPPELWDIAAPQSIDQTKMYQDSVRFFTEPGPPAAAAAMSWRSFACRAFLEARGLPNPGPVHLNLSFREPLLGLADAVPPGRANNRPWHRIGEPSTSSDLEAIDPQVIELLSTDKGVIIAGEATEEPEAVQLLSKITGWPLLANHQSGCRSNESIQFFNFLLSDQIFSETYLPKTILRFGSPLASKALSQWITKSAEQGCSIAAITSRWCDPERVASFVLSDKKLATHLVSCFRKSAKYQPSHWIKEWQKADKIAGQTTSDVLENIPSLTEPTIAQLVTSHVPSGGDFVLSSSMPVRDVEWFGLHRDDIRVFSNRGANGIDGVLSTAIGTALSGNPTTLLIGDIAFLHDSSALVALADRPIKLTIVIVDNTGGGIFSFLPQSEALQKAQFEKLFTTPHQADIEKLLAAHGVATQVCEKKPELEQSLRSANKKGGSKAILVKATTNPINAHQQVQSAITSAFLEHKRHSGN